MQRCRGCARNDRSRVFSTTPSAPVGTVVELDTDERAVITKVDRSDPWRPTVEIVTDHDRRRLREPRTLDLAASRVDGSEAPRIRSVVTAQQPSDDLLTVDVIPTDAAGFDNEFRDDRELMAREG